MTIVHDYSRRHDCGRLNRWLVNQTYKDFAAKSARSPACRPDAHDVERRHPDDCRKRPFSPTLSAIADSYSEPDAQRGEHQAERWEQDGHAAIVSGVTRGREGKYCRIAASSVSPESSIGTQIVAQPSPGSILLFECARGSLSDVMSQGRLMLGGRRWLVLSVINLLP